MKVFIYDILVMSVLYRIKTSCWLWTWPSKYSGTEQRIGI